MITRIIVIALIAGVVYLNYTVPTIDDHKAMLRDKLQLGYALPEEMEEKIWKEVDYSNFFVCSFMKNTESSVMISYGYLKKVKLANDKWVEETRKEIAGRSDYY